MVREIGCRIAAQIVIICIAFGAGMYFAKPKVVQNIKPPEHVVLKPVNKSDCDDLYIRAITPIEITRKLTGRTYKITASDTYKRTTAYDQIPGIDYSLIGGLGLELPSLRPVYSLYFLRHSVLAYGGGVSVYSGSMTVSVLAGYSF